MSEDEQMPLEIWTDINGNATRTQFKGGVKYIRADERDRLRWALNFVVKTASDSELSFGDRVSVIRHTAQAALTPAGGGPK